MAQQYDLSDDGVVVVIGSGAGGGTVANELAQRGVDVVCLEAGSRLEITDIKNDPPYMFDKLGWQDTRYGKGVWLCKTVGGTTMYWSGVSPRFKAYEFLPKTTYGAIQGTSLIDWPITLEEVEPYYALAEAKMGVSGTNGLPPSAENNNFKVLKAAAQRIGYSDIKTTGIAINSAPYDGRPMCRQIGFCNEGCAIGAKWSTLYTEIPKAEATGRFELRANCMATKINHDASGKVTGVIYTDPSGEQREQKARVVCVAGNVVETTRLLLLSESSLFPHGLANSSGHVGKNYMRHVAYLVAAVMPGPVHNYRGARQAGVIADEHRHDPSRGFAGGYLFETMGDGPMRFANMAGWGVEAAGWMEKYDHLAAVFFVGEDLPESRNQISLHATDLDENGLPIPVVQYELHSNSEAMIEHASRQARSMYAALGATEFRDDINPESGGCHNMGVARMSSNPNDGVTNKWGRAHDVPNLFVSDGSVFSSSAASNPTLTIVALAIRQAEHIAASMARGEL